MGVFGESIIFNILILICACIVGLYTTFGYLRRKWTRKNIPSSNVHPIFGNLQDIVFGRKLFMDAYKDFYLQHRKKPFIAFYTFMQPMIVINDLELIRHILIKDFSHFTDRNVDVSMSDPLSYHSMFTTKGQTWRNLRSNLSPTFTSGKMKLMFDFVDDCGKQLVTCLEKEIGENGEVGVKEIFSRFTTDVIATCAFGINGNSLKDPESVFRKYLRKAIDVDVWQTIVGSLMFLFPAVGRHFKFVPSDVEKFFRKAVWDTVEYRETNNVNRNDFLGLMLQLKNFGSLKNYGSHQEDETAEETREKIDLEGDKFVSQCFLFLTAGHDTSSTTMTGAMFEMALNQDIQNRTYEEIITTLRKYNGQVTYDAVQEMKYLDMVLHETLRKYPILLFLDRAVTQPYHIPNSDVKLEVGDSVMIPVIGLHHDPDLYPDPDRFDPERFSEEQKKLRPSCSFLGFGDGPRICIGMRMGLMQAKVGLIHTLLNYQISPTAATKIPMPFKNSAVSQFKGEIPLRFTRRNVRGVED